MALQLPLLPTSIIQHLVTAETPATSNSSSMDYVRCAALHNHIYEMAWSGSGRALNEMPRENWFERHGREAEQLRPVLQPSLVKFLEQAYAVPLTEISFFYYVNGLAPPDQFWENNLPDWVDDDSDPQRWLTLYTANVNIGSHIDGLNYDQVHNTVVMQVDTSDRDWTRNGEDSDLLWFPLECLLSKWLEMVRIGKITAEHDEIEAPNERYGPWTYYAWSEPQLDATVAAFHKMTAAIEAKMSINTSAPSPSTLVSVEVLQGALVREGTFAHAFLSVAKRPDSKIKYIAPGLTFPSRSGEAFRALQQFTSLDISSDNRNAHGEDEAEEDRKNHVPPVLLFPFDTSTKIKLNPDDSDNSCFNFRYHRKLASTSPDDDDGILAGLYTDSVDRRHTITEAEEGFRLILPFPIGDRELARRSDMTTFHNHVSLYQHGFFPFGGEVWRAQRLQRLFEKWEQNVHNGVWDVGSEGVLGGAEKWRDADEANLEETAYRLDVDW